MPESEDFLKSSWQDSNKEEFLVSFVNRFESVPFLIGIEILLSQIQFKMFKIAC